MLLRIFVELASPYYYLRAKLRLDHLASGVLLVDHKHPVSAAIQCRLRGDELRCRLAEGGAPRTLALCPRTLLQRIGGFHAHDIQEIHVERDIALALWVILCRVVLFLGLLCLLVHRLHHLRLNLVGLPLLPTEIPDQALQPERGIVGSRLATLIDVQVTARR